MNYILSIALLLTSVYAAAEDVLPAGCKPVVVSGELVALVTDSSAVVILHNLSHHDLWITHPVSDPSASAGWSSRLQPDNWSALALRVPTFELSCVESTPGHEQQVPCSGVVAVCQWETSKMPPSTKGTLWAGEDLALPTLLSHLGRSGYGLGSQ